MLRNAPLDLVKKFTKMRRIATLQHVIKQRFQLAVISATFNQQLG